MIMFPVIIPSPVRYGSECDSEPVSLVDSLKGDKQTSVFFHLACFGVALTLILMFEVLCGFVSDAEPATLITILGLAVLRLVMLLGEYCYYMNTLNILCLHQASAQTLNLDAKTRRRHYGLLSAASEIAIALGAIGFFLMRPRQGSFWLDESAFASSFIYMLIAALMIMELILFGCSVFKVHRERRRWRNRRATDPNFQMTFAEYAHAVESEAEKAPAQKNRRHHREQHH